MAKLAIELTSDKNTKRVVKGGDRTITAELIVSNCPLGTVDITHYSDGITYVRYTHPKTKQQAVLYISDPNKTA